MKKFFKFGKKKKAGDVETASVASGSKAHSRSGSIASETGVYIVRDKDLPKLHKAAWTGDLNKVKQLAKKNVNELDKSNRTALHFACSKGNAAIVQELLEWKAKPNIGDNQQRTPLIKAVQAGSRPCVQLLLEERAEVNAADADGNAALHHAVESCDVEVINLLLDCGRINIDIQNKEGQSPLHYAAQEKRQEVARALIRGGADINLQDYEGRTPLMVCCNEGSVDVAKLLLQNGADSKAKNAAGWTADDIAIMANHDNCREVIAQFLDGGGRPPPAQQQNPQQQKSGGRSQEDTGQLYGMPAADEGDISDPENTMSKTSDAPGVDSWADSEDESELGAARNKKEVKNVPKLNLTSMMEQRKQNSPAKTEPSGAAARPAPVSSRSGVSVDDPSTWSDNEGSLFSSMKDTKQPKAADAVAAAPNVSARVLDEEKTENDDWSDEDVSLPIGGSTAKPAAAAQGKKETLVSKRPSEEGEEDENKKNEMREQKGTVFGVDRNKAKQLLAELGISDVSDVSDPNFSGDDVNPALKLSTAASPAKRKTALKNHSDEESDWDSDQDEGSNKKFSGAATGRPVDSGRGKDALNPGSARGTGLQPPPSVKDEDDAWDSSGADDAPGDKGHQVSSFRDQQNTQVEEETGGRPQKQVPVSAASTGRPAASAPDQVDNEIDDHIEDLLTPPLQFNGLLFTRKTTGGSGRHSLAESDSPPPPLPTSPPPRLLATPPGRDKAGSDADDSKWDSEEEDEGQSKHQPEATVKPPNQDQPTAAAEKKPGAATSEEKKMYAAADDDDDWDSDTSLPLEENSPATQPAAAPPSANKPAVFGGVETESSEESESEWEKENKAKKHSEAARQQKWEAEFEQQQERLRREAAEELQKEKEEQDRQKIIAEEEEKIERLKKQKEEEDRLERHRREKEEELRLERLRQQAEEEERLKQIEEERRKLEKRNREEREKLDREEREREKIERRRREEEIRRKEEKWKREQKEAEEKRKNWLTQSSNTRDDVKGMGGLSDESEEGHEVSPRGSLQTSAPPVVPPKPTLKHSSSSLDQHNKPLDIPVAEITETGMSREPRVNGHQEDDDDCLSYSSTEHDFSLHDTQHNVSTAPANVTGSLNVSYNNDSVTSPRLQEQLRDLRRQLDRERSMRISLENRRKNIEAEKSELLQKLEDVTRAKSSLEQVKIDLDSKLRTLQYNLNEEAEKRKNAEMLYNKTKEQLARKDEQYTQEVEAKQNTELAMRNIQIEMRTTMVSAKQMEEEKEDLSRQLQHEKSARMLQEQINQEQLKLHDSFGGKEDAVTTAAQAEVYGKLSETLDESRDSAITDNAEKLRAELYATKMEFERQKKRFQDDHGLLTSENEELQNRVEELKSDIKLNEDALAHASMQYNIQLSQLRTDHTVLTSSLEKERNNHEKTQAEITSLQSRLQTTTAELEKAQAARNQLEKHSYQSGADWYKSVEKKDQEIAELKELKQSLTHRLETAETRASSFENEVHIANATLAERTSQLQTLQRELDSRRATQESIEENLSKEKESRVRLEARLESVQDKLSSTQHETLRLQQQLDEARASRGDPSGEHITLLTQLKHDQQATKVSLEERNASLNENVIRLREELRGAEERKVSLERELKHLQKELADVSKKCSIAEASLEVSNRARDHLESERVSMKKEIDKLQNKLDAATEKYMASDAKASQLADRVHQADYSTQMTSQQLHNQSGNIETLAKTKAELDEAVHRLELEKTKLEAALDHEQQKTHALQSDLAESHQIRDTLESIVSNLRSTNEHLEGKMGEALAAKSVANHEAEDSRDLWESEVKSRSKLGLRIVQLERQKQQAESKLEEEKKKTRKVLEMRKLGESRLDTELDKNGQLHKEVAALKSHLKSTKRRLKEISSGDFERERNDLNITIRLLKRQLEDVNGQLQTEQSGKARLQSELNSLRVVEKTLAKLERAKRKVEQDFKEYKDYVGSHYVERASAARVHGDVETRTRQELNSKLQEVTAHMEEQSRARDRIDAMRDDNDNMMRREFQSTKKELLDELNQMKALTKETLDEKQNKDLELQKLKEVYEAEQKLREKLANRLERATDKANKAQLYVERQRLGGSLPVQNGWMSAPASPMGGGSSALAKPGGAITHGVNDLSYSMRAELDRSIAKHLEKSPHIDISVPPRSVGGADDPALRGASFEQASNEYLRVLHKNYML